MIIAALVLGVSTTTLAEDRKTGVEVFDEIRDELTLLHTGKGGYIAVRVNRDKEELYIFSGNRKLMYEVRKTSPSMSTDTKTKRRLYDLRFADPRYGFREFVRVLYKDKKWSLQCGNESTPLTVVAKRQAKKILRKVVIKPKLHDRRAVSLSRDDRGIYYYVDELMNGQGTRLFIGRKGRLVKQRLVDQVSDSEGALLITKKGTLRFELFGRTPQSEGVIKAVEWIADEKHLVVRDVPVLRNRYLIHAELGVYGDRMGTPCDLL